MPSKFSRRLGRRGVLSAKRGNMNFYKGTGARKEGVHTTKGEMLGGGRAEPLRGWWPCCGVGRAVQARSERDGGGAAWR